MELKWKGQHWDHLVISCFQSRKSSSKTDISGGSNGVGLKLGPLERSEMIPGETLASWRTSGLKLLVE